MLSILIPVYNYDIRKLLHQLVNQCTKLHLNYEIICLDDASSSNYWDYYNQIKKELKIQWLTTTKNIGRSAARNSLAKQANFDNILFLDCDVELPDEHFISRYQKYFQQQTEQIIYGSCIYPIEKPTDQNLLLHWRYGTIKENPPLKERLKHPYDTFHTVNFLVKRKLILANPFDESISRYGYEDSLWARNIKEKRIKITHIDNPVLHKGIQPAKQFLRKTAQAIRNLIYLELNKKNLNTRLLHFQKKIQSFGLERFVFKMYKLNERRIVQNLLSSNPSLFCYSIYKMGLLIRLRKKLM